MEANPAQVTIAGEEILVAYNIKIYAGPTLKALGISWQPGEDAVTVRMKSDALNGNYANVYHINAESDLPEIVSEAVELQDHSVTFAADTFSVYAVSTAPRKTFYFFNEKDMSTPYYFKLDNTSVTTNRQIIKDGEALVMPQLPEREGLTFIGWFNCETDEQQAFGETISVTEDETINLYSRFGNVVYVHFHAAKDNGVWPISFSRAAELQNGSAVVTISDITAIPISDTQVFLGWTKDLSAAEDPTNTTYIEDDEITVTQNVDLYPVFAEAHWIRFSSGEAGNGASYKAPQYQLTNNTDSNLGVVTRTGYTFKGWYAGADDHLNGEGAQVTDENGNVLPNLSFENASSDSTGNLSLTGDITLYARWEANDNTKYTVVYWLQRVSDEPGLANNAKTYDYYGADTSRMAQTGSTVTLRSSDKNSSQVGGSGTEYVFNSANSTPSAGVTVEADGSTVLNVYFDLAEVTLTFQVQQGSSWTTVTSVTGLYGQSIAYIFNEEPLKTYRDQGYTWRDYYGEVYSEILSTIELVPAKNVTFRGSSGGNASTVYYYLESLDQTSGVSGTRRAFAINGQQVFFDLYKTIQHNYNFLTYNEEYHPIDGFQMNRAYAEPYFGERGRYVRSSGTFQNQDMAPIGGYTTERTTTSHVNYLYYVRESYPLTLRNYNNDQISQSTYKYEQIISDPGTPDITYAPMQDAGYYFTGWYADQGCSTRVFFSEEEAEAKKEETKDDDGNYNYVIISQMPSQPLSLFAGWAQQKFPVTINPDGGVLSDTESTYFNSAYGERILEYTDVTRHYVEREEGDTHPDSEIYYYYYDTKELNDSTGNTTRKAYYYPKSEGVKPQTRLDGNGQPVEYIYNPGTYTLVGWYRVVNGKLDLYDFTSKVTEETTLQAVWRKSGIWYVKYDAQNAYHGRGTGVIMDEGTPTYTVQLNTEYADGAMVVLTKAAEPEEGSEWQFVGWHIKGDDTNAIYYPNEGMVYRSAFADSNNVLTLEAVYEKISKTSVTYDANGGVGTLTSGGTLVLENGSQEPLSAVNNKVDNLENNSEIIFSTGEGFTRDGYRQIGWSIYAGRTEDDFDPSVNTATDFFNDGVTGYVVDDPNGNILYAVWEKTYSIVYRPNGGTGALAGLTSNGDGSYSERDIVKGSDAVVTEKEYVRAGYRFTGWNTEADGSGTSYEAEDVIANISANVVLYAQWEKLLHIIYDANGGTGTLTDPSCLVAIGSGQFNSGDIYILNSSVTLSNGETLTRGGYMLTGWNTAADGSGEHYDCSEAITITEDMTLYAEWTPLYNLVYNANGGSGTLTDGGSYVYDGSTTVLQNANAYADIPQGSIVTLSSGNGFSRLGYTQIGWNSSREAANAGTAEYGLEGSTLTLSGDTTLYAVWFENKTINYHLNGGTGTPEPTDGHELTPLSSSVYSSGKVYLPGGTTTLANAGTMEREGYSLLGWSTDAARTAEAFSAGNGTDYAPGGSITVNADTDLYAVWQKKLHIIYDLNGGSGTLTDPEGLVSVASGQFSTGDIYVSGTDVTVSSGAGISHSGFELTGWNTAADGSGTYYALDGVLSGITEDTTLYAQWGGTIYLKLVNDTGAALTGISVSLPNGMMVSGSSNLTENLAAGEEKTLAVTVDQALMSRIIADTATDAEKQFTVSGTNSLGASYTLVVESQLGDAGVTGRSTAANGDDYYVTDILSPAATMTVTFTAERQRVLSFETNGGTAIDPVIFNTGDTSYTMPVPVRPGYSFQGWAETNDGPVVVPGGYTVDVDDLFPAGVYERTAYAVWTEVASGTGEVLVYKNVTGDGDKEKEFTFTVDLNASYSATISEGGCGGSTTTDTFNATGEKEISLKHGEYFKIKIEHSDGSNSSSYETLKVTLQKYAANGTSSGNPIDVCNESSDKQANYTTESFNLSVTETSDGYTTARSISNSSFGDGGSGNGSAANNTFTIATDTDVGGTVVFNNDLQTPKSNITIVKTPRMIANDPLKASENFTFEVTKDGAFYKRFTISNLAGANSYLLEDVPVGAVLSVTELGAADYDTEAAVTGGSVADGPASSNNKTYTFTVGSDDAEITFTNTRKTAMVDVTKALVNDLLTEEQKDALDFTVQAALTTAGNVPISGYAIQDNNGNEVGTTDTGGRISFTVSRLRGKSLKLPVGAKLTLSELNADEYELTASATGLNGSLEAGFMVDDDGGSVLLTNTLKTANITVLKVVEDGLASDNSVPFGFEAKLYDGSDNLLNYGSFQTGTQSFSLSAGNARTLTVPLGAKLAITETTVDTEKYTVSASGSQGSYNSSDRTYVITSVPAAGSIVTFTNTRNKVQIVISKTLNDPVAATAKPFTFTAVLTDNGAAVADYYLSSFPRIRTNSTGEAEFTIEVGNGETATRTLMIPYGASLTVQENEKADYDTSGEATGGSYAQDTRAASFTGMTADGAASFTNTIKNQTVYIEKTVIDPLNTVSSFSFTAVLKNEDGVAIPNLDTGTAGITGTDGKVEFSLADAGKQALTVPVGVTVEITELAADLYTTTADAKGAGKISGSLNGKTYTFTVPSDGTDNQRTVIFTNTKPYVPVTVTKTLDDALNGSDPVNFSFTLQVYPDSQMETAIVLPETWTVNDNTSTLSAGGQTGIFTISTNHGNSASQTFYLPLGTYVTITETEDTRYRTTVSENGVESVGQSAAITPITASGGYSYTFTNTRRTVPVTVMKVNDAGVSLNGATFALTDGTPASGSVAINGSSTVFVGELYYGSSITLQETVYPVNYEQETSSAAVITAGDAGTVTASGASVTGPDEDGRYTVSIRNTRNIEMITVTKKLDDLLSAGEVDFPFLAVLTDENGQPISNYRIDGDYTTDTGGEYEFTIPVSNGGTASKTLYVPRGTNLLVQEKLDDGLTAVYTTTVEDVQASEKSFTNVQAGDEVTFTNTRKTARVYIDKSLSDIFAGEAQSFAFRATLEKQDGQPIALYDTAQGRPAETAGENTTDAQGQLSFNLSVPDGQTAERYLVVPVGSKLKVEEVLTEGQIKAYSTTVKYNNNEAETGTEKQIDSVLPDVNSTLLFVNTRKTVTVTLTKRLLGSETGSFAFTAEVFYNNVRLNYNLNNFTEGLRSFSLEKDASIELVVPMGSTLVLTEPVSGTKVIDSVTAYSEVEVTDSDSAENIFSFVASADTAIEWTNRILPAPTGVHLQAEPYLMILTVGLLIGLICWTDRKKKEDETDQ